MRPQSQFEIGAGKRRTKVFSASRREDTGGIVTTRHQLLTRAWTADVERLEDAIERFTADCPLADNCQVHLFEMPGDRHLHVNVTHYVPTVSPPGWAGPGRVADGFIHNRRFVHMPPDRMIRFIRDMVFAARA